MGSDSGSEKNVEAFRALIEAQARRDVPALLALVTDDFVMDYPLKPPGHPERVQGKDEITEMFGAVADGLPGLELTDLVLHPGADPDYVVAEFRLHGPASGSAPGYDSRYLTSARFRDGQIYWYELFFDPISLARSMGADDVIREALDA